MTPVIYSGELFWSPADFVRLPTDKEKPGGQETSELCDCQQGFWVKSLFHSLKNK